MIRAFYLNIANSEVLFAQDGLVIVKVTEHNILCSVTFLRPTLSIKFEKNYEKSMDC